MSPTAQSCYRFILTLASCAAFASGCSKSDSSAVTVAASASALASSTAPASAMVVKYTIAPDGKTSIDMPAPNEHIKAGTTVSDGSLDVDLKNIANTRGTVKVDLSSLTTTTFDDAKKNSGQTEHAHNWLEIGSLVTPDVMAANKYIVFALRTIDGTSAPDVTAVAPTKEGGEDIRTVTFMAHGEILLHGHKSNKDVSLEAKFHYPAGAAADSKPTKIEIATKAPLHIVLAEHDVKPRDNFGKLATASFNLLGTKVADAADIMVMLTATPQ